MRSDKVLRRSSRDCIIAGVCGGLAEFFGLSSFNVRLIYVLASICSVAFPGILVYIMLWLTIPKEGEY